MIQERKHQRGLPGAQLAGARKNCPAGDEVEVPLSI